MDIIHQEAKKLGATVTSDKTNQNGRFVRIRASHDKGAMQTTDILRHALRPNFANVSNVSYDRGTWSFQTTTRFPKITGRGVLHRPDEFGDVTNIYIS